MGGRTLVVGHNGKEKAEHFANKGPTTLKPRSAEPLAQEGLIMWPANGEDKVLTHLVGS